MHQPFILTLSPSHYLKEKKSREFILDLNPKERISHGGVSGPHYFLSADLGGVVTFK
jgi:hypothetical protein